MDPEELELRRKLLRQELGGSQIDPQNFEMLLKRQQQVTPFDKVKESLGIQEPQQRQQQQVLPQPQNEQPQQRMSKYGKPLVDGTDYEEGTSTHPQTQDVEQDPFVAPWNSFRRQTRRKPAPDEARAEMAVLKSERQQFESFRQQLTQNFGRMDPVARSYYNDMQKRAMAIEKAYHSGKLKPIEYLRGINELSGRAKTVLWDKHFTAPGSQPGDIVIQEGIRSIRQKDGSLEHVGYTPEYVRANTKRLPNGKMLVPVSPGKPDVEIEDKRSVEAGKMFDDQWNKAGKEFSDINGRTPGYNIQTGAIGDTPELLKELEDFRARVRASTLDMYTEKETFRIELDRKLNAAEAGEDSSDLERVSNEQSAARQQQMQEQLTSHVQGMQQQQIQSQQQIAGAQSAQSIEQNQSAAQQKNAPTAEADILIKLPEEMRTPTVTNIAKEMSQIRQVTAGKLVKGSNEEQKYRALAQQLRDELVRMRALKDQQKGK